MQESEKDQGVFRPDHSLQKRAENEVAGKATLLAMLEIGLGSFVHAFNIPFSGHCLSINQGCVLIHSDRKIRGINPSFKHTPFYISMIVSLLKSLSPAGKKLGPMLSIAMQGFLFWLPTSIMGGNLLSYLIGITLLSFWAFIQPLVTLYLFFGHSLVDAFGFYLEKMQTKLGVEPAYVMYGLLALVGAKVLVCWVCALLTFYSEKFYLEKFQNKILKYNSSMPKIKHNESHSHLSTIKLSLLDLTKPMFLSSFILLVVFWVFNRSEYSSTVWILLRPLAVAFLFFYVSRHPYFYKAIERLNRYDRTKPLYRMFVATRMALEEKKLENG